MINAGTLQEDGYNEQYAEEALARSNSYKGISSCSEVCEYYQHVGLAQTGTHKLLQIPRKK